jgi:hypothetical protein
MERIDAMWFHRTPLTGRAAAEEMDQFIDDLASWHARREILPEMGSEARVCGDRSIRRIQIEDFAGTQIRSGLGSRPCTKLYQRS